jgi:hypothetical protein
LAGTAAGAYALHGLITDTGPAGWINYFQQSIFGSYSMKVTVLVLTFGVLAVATLAWGLASIGRPDQPASIPVTPGADRHVAGSHRRAKQLEYFRSGFCRLHGDHLGNRIRRPLVEQPGRPGRFRRRPTKR